MATKDLEIGDLCIFAHWSDMKSEDATFIGILDYIEGDYYYARGSSRGFRYIRKLARRHPWNRLTQVSIIKGGMDNEM